MNSRTGVGLAASLLVLGLCSAPGVVASATEAPVSTDDPGLSLGFSVTTIAGVEAVVGASGGALEVAAIVNQTLIGNQVVERNVRSRDSIEPPDAFQDNQGILNVNQAAGILNNQAIVISISATTVAGVEAVVGASGGALEGAAIVNQTLIGNQVVERNVTSRGLIQDAFQDNRGILSVNQAEGSLNNQAIVRVLTLGAIDSPVQALDFSGSSRTLDNTLISSGGERENRISNSFGGTVGIVGANQSAGNLNQQANVLVLGLGAALGPEVVALGEATLGEISARNTVKQEGPAGPRADILTDSFAGFRGIAQVNQSAGDLNHMGNFVGLSLTVLTLP